MQPVLPSFNDRPMFYAASGYPHRNPSVTDGGAGKLDEILSLLKTQQEEITHLKNEIRFEWLCAVRAYIFLCRWPSSKKALLKRSDQCV